MNFSMRTFAIGMVIALAIGFLIGFIPQHMKADTAAREKNRAQTQRARAEEEAQVSGFTNRVAVVYLEAEKKNFAQAGSDASKLFTAMQSYSEQTSNSGVRQELSTFLSMRDAIISGLAKGDGAVTGQLRELLLKMQSVGLSSNTAG